MQSPLGLDALDGHARTHDLGQTVDIDGVQPQVGLDLGPHRLGPGLGPEDADPQLGRLDVHPLGSGLLGQVERVGGGAGQHGGAKILHDHDLTLGVAAGDRDHRGPQLLGAVMGPQAAGKQAVAVGIMDDVTPMGAGRHKGAGHQVGPGADILLGVAHHGRLAGGAARCVNPDDLFQRRSKQAIGVGVAHILLGGERQPLQVVQTGDILRLHAGLVE